MKRLYLITILLSTFACSQEKGFKRIDATEAKNLIENSDIQIIDVRTEYEYNQGHLQNAKLMNMMSSTFLEKIKTMDKEKKYLLYCRSGNRSLTVAKKLKQLGFKSLYELKHGINEWYSMNYETVK